MNYKTQTYVSNPFVPPYVSKPPYRMVLFNYEMLEIDDAVLCYAKIPC